MTPWVSNLLKEAQNPSQVYNLRSDAPLFELQHPLALKAQLNFKENPEAELPSITIPGWNYYCFANASQVQKIKIVLARPYLVYEILKDDPSIFALDFLDWGTIILSKGKLDLPFVPGLHQHVLPYWAHYIVSSELWGPHGKWTRFHERLQQLFVKFNLIAVPASPGLYLLKPEAQKLSSHGFMGNLESGSFVLNMPWTFPLSGLDRLERIVAQEF